MVIFEGTILNAFELVSSGALGNVSIVISDHFIEESFGLISGGSRQAVVFHDVHNIQALVVKFTLDLFLVLGKTLVEFLVLWVLLDGGNGSDSSSL